MTAYTLSVVQLCPDAYRAQANAIAAAHGYGDVNLSVELRHTDGSTWWGCHAWWIPEALAVALQPPDEVTGAAEILDHAITSVVDRESVPEAEREGLPLRHWLQALSTNGLSVVEPETA